MVDTVVGDVADAMVGTVNGAAAGTVVDAVVGVLLVLLLTVVGALYWVRCLGRVHSRNPLLITQLGLLLDPKINSMTP